MTAKLDAMEHRWVTSLANYNFHLHYRSGKSNVEADALSQINRGENDKTLPTDSIQAIVTDALTGQGNDYMGTIPCSTQSIESFIPSIHDSAQVVCKSMMVYEIESNLNSYICPDPSWNPNCMTISDWVKVQAEGQVIHELIQWYRAKELHRDQDMDSLEMKQFLRQRGKLLLRNGILYCKNDTKEPECPDQNTMQLVLPTALRIQALKGCHDDLGHLGIEITLDFLRDRFYWPGMTEDMTRHI